MLSHLQTCEVAAQQNEDTILKYTTRLVTYHYNTSSSNDNKHIRIDSPYSLVITYI